MTPKMVFMPRQLSRPRPAQAAKLVALRKAAGLSQFELAELIGENPRNIAYWETCAHPPRSDALPNLARVLNCAVEDLLTGGPQHAHKPGPVGRLQRVMAEIAHLPKRRQDRIVDVIEALLERAA